jgi:hypothetical protein
MTLANSTYVLWLFILLNILSQIALFLYSITQLTLFHNFYLYIIFTQLFPLNNTR